MMQNIKKILFLLIVQGCLLQAAEESKMSEIDNLSDSYWTSNKRKADDVENTIHQNSSSKKIRQESQESTLMNQAMLIDSDKPMELTEDILFQLHKNRMNNVLQELQESQAKVRWKRNEKITSLLSEGSFCRDNVLEFLGGYTKPALAFSRDQTLIPYIILKQRQAIIQSVQSNEYEDFKKACVLLDVYRSLLCLSNPSSSNFVQSSSDFIKNYKNGRGDTALHIAFYLTDEGNSEMSLVMYYVIGKDKDPAIIYPENKECGINILESLLNCGVNIDMQGEEERTVLHHAAQCGSAEAVKFLLERGAKAEIQDQEGRTAFYDAVQLSTKIEVVQVMIDHGVNIHAKNKDDETPLHEAALCDKNVKKIKLLLKLDASVHACNKYGQTPLHTAASSVYGDTIEIIELLLDHGALIDLQDQFGKTSLHAAAEVPKIKIVEFLIARGANLDIRDNEEKTPDDYNLWADNHKIQALIVQARIDRAAQQIISEN